MLSRTCFNLKRLMFNQLRLETSTSNSILLCNYFEHKQYSTVQNIINDRYKVLVIPALSDNFMYLLTDKISRSAFVIDPVEPDKILEVLKKEKCVLNSVLTTHHHLDHAGGNETISKLIKNIPIYGGDDRIPAMTKNLLHSDKFKIEDLTVECLHTPCHTSGHVCYFIKFDNTKSICFTGDTLFVGGCGRFFEGSASHMLQSLNILSSLPLKTLIYCGHEYTLSNLKFALHVEPENPDVHKKLKDVEEKVKNGVCTVPSTIEDELSYNPFMRTNVKTVQIFTGHTNPIEVMKILRERKNNFK